MAKSRPSSDEFRRGAIRASNDNRMFIGANAMRCFLALGLLITLCASASAATVHHSGHHVIIRPSQSWAYAPRSMVAARRCRRHPEARKGPALLAPAIVPERDVPAGRLACWILFNFSRKLPGHENRLPDAEA
jgi:hypothetical protein